MCDTLCALTTDGTLFAKNSDRPAGEVQLPEVHAARPAGGSLRTQYLAIEDGGAGATLLSRPEWLWGAEHGVNEHGVAIGNEKIDTVSGVGTAEPALIGMDLVRLGLERGGDAESALDVMVGLLERHGQGGIGDRTFGQAYDSSFLVADPASAWVLETAGRTWAAEPVPAGGSVAISNRLTIRRGWTRASADVPPGADFDAWRDPGVGTGYADRRLAASRAFLASARGADRSPAARGMVAHLRDHGCGPWGEPDLPGTAGTAGAAGRPPGAVPPPSEVDADGTGVTVCMHVGGLMATTASMVTLLPKAGAGPLRTWVAVGSPCVSVYVPLFGLPDLPARPVVERLWHDTASLRRRVEAEAGALAAVRAALDPLEADLWGTADDLVDRPEQWGRFCARAWRQVADAVSALVGPR